MRLLDRRIQKPVMQVLDIKGVLDSPIKLASDACAEYYEPDINMALTSE